MGIEPTRPAWKAGILPLNYTRKNFTLDDEIYFIIPNIICQEFFSKKTKNFFCKNNQYCYLFFAVLSGSTIPVSFLSKLRFLMYADIMEIVPTIIKETRKYSP